MNVLLSIYDLKVWFLITFYGYSLLPRHGMFSYLDIIYSILQVNEVQKNFIKILWYGHPCR